MQWSSWLRATTNLQLSLKVCPVQKTEKAAADSWSISSGQGELFVGSRNWSVLSSHVKCVLVWEQDSLLVNSRKYCLSYGLSFASWKRGPPGRALDKSNRNHFSPMGALRSPRAGFGSFRVVLCVVLLAVLKTGIESVQILCPFFN